MPNTRELAQIIDRETGDVNNLRDKKLADATAQQQSGSASTDSVVMKTTGGEYVEIARDSFVGAIKGVMDGLIKGNSYTTLGANDPIAAFNSNALGGITPANLASVLGVRRYYIAAGTTIDTGVRTYTVLSNAPATMLWMSGDTGGASVPNTSGIVSFSWSNINKVTLGTPSGTEPEFSVANNSTLCIKNPMSSGTLYVVLIG